MRRRQLHDVYGGNRSGNGGSSSTTPNTFLFVRTAPEVQSVPSWDGRVLSVPGCLQDGDYISRENQMLIHHMRRGLPLRVFEQRQRLCRYLGEFAVDQEAPVASWVRTGVRKPVGRSTDATWEVQFPLLRLRQLSGGPCFDSAAPPFPVVGKSGQSVDAGEAAGCFVVAEGFACGVEAFVEQADSFVFQGSFGVLAEGS